MRDHPENLIYPFYLIHRPPHFTAHMTKPTFQYIRRVSLHILTIYWGACLSSFAAQATTFPSSQPIRPLADFDSVRTNSPNPPFAVAINMSAPPGLSLDFNATVTRPRPQSTSSRHSKEFYSNEHVAQTIADFAAIARRTHEVTSSATSSSVLSKRSKTQTAKGASDRKRPSKKGRKTQDEPKHST